VGFLTSGKFWSGLLHAVSIGASAYLAVKHGAPIDGAIAGGLTALAGVLPSSLGVVGAQKQ